MTTTWTGLPTKGTLREDIARKALDSRDPKEEGAHYSWSLDSCLDVRLIGSFYLLRSVGQG